MHVVHANGAPIPAIGFGTWELRGMTARAMVEMALATGYRHIDTAQMYQNEREVGMGLRASGLPRRSYFLTTKIWPDFFRPEDLVREAKAAIDRLETHVDLLLLHWPSKTIPLAETIPALDSLVDAKITRFTGVSNFTTAMLDEAAGLARHKLVCNQVEYHPFLNQDRVLAACRRHGMALTAYCPLARGRVFKDPLLQRIAARHGKTPGQVALRWLIQQDGVVAIPRSGSAAHAKANVELDDFALTAEEMAAIKGLADPAGRICDYDFSPAWDPA
jgi:diketogulonate reductase-like aldo/keto reductase